MTGEGKEYERDVYKLLDMFGNVGGLFEIYKICGAIIVYILCTHSLQVKHISVLNHPKYENTQNIKTYINT